MAQRDVTTAGKAIPRFALKSVKIYNRMSEETLAFDANVYLDGKRIGYAKNDGQGGCTFVDVDPAHRSRVEPLFATVANEIAPIVVDGKTRCCGAGTRKPYVGTPIEVCATCDRMIHVPGEPFLDGPAAYVVDALVEREQIDREERKLQKIDRAECAKNEPRGMLTMRWRGNTPRGVMTVWPAIKPDQTPEQVAAEMDAKYKTKGTWKVVS